MSLTEAAARAGLQDAEEKVGRRRSHMSLELLGRAHLWLDEPDAAREAFLAAVADLQERIYDRGRDGYEHHSRRGGLLLLAGERDEAHTWLRRALEEPPGDGSADMHGSRIAQRAAALGDAAAAAEAVRACGPEFVRAHAAVAVAAGEHGRARELLVPIVAEKPPWEQNGAEPLAGWDWWALALQGQAAAAGEPAPSRAAMLAAA